MKKAGLFLLLVYLFMLCVPSAFAQEDDLPAIKIYYASEAVLTQDVDVSAKVTVDGVSTFDAMLRLYSGGNDIIEKALPQKSLEIEGKDVRFTLYNDGVDGRNTKIISMVCCDLIEQSAVSVPIRAQEPVIVYLNDEYWGLYTRREHIEDAIARFEGLDDATILNIANANCATVYGNATGLKEVIRKLMNLNGSSDESQQIQNHLLDVESFLKCLALNAYFGNSNFYGSLFFYQINDGPWKCAMGDLAYSFTTAQDNSIARFVSQGKGGIPHGDIAIIADQLLKVPEYRDLFLAQMGALYQTLTTPLMQAAADAAYLRIADALPAHDDRWTSEFIQAAGDDMSYPVTDVAEAKLFHNYRVYRLRDKTMLTRPWYVFDSVQRELQVTDDDMERYFGSLSPDLPEVPGDNWDSYKSANQ